MKLYIEIDANRPAESLEMAKNFIINSNIISNFPNPVITITIEEDN